MNCSFAPKRAISVKEVSLVNSQSGTTHGDLFQHLVHIDGRYLSNDLMNPPLAISFRLEDRGCVDDVTMGVKLQP